LKSTRILWDDVAGDFLFKTTCSLFSNIYGPILFHGNDDMWFRIWMSLKNKIYHQHHQPTEHEFFYISYKFINMDASLTGWRFRANCAFKFEIEPIDFHVFFM
jgi:WD40 repeat protein